MSNLLDFFKKKPTSTSAAANVHRREPQPGSVQPFKSNPSTSTQELGFPDIQEQPHQPKDTSFMQSYTVQSKTGKFVLTVQQHWFKTYTWLHCDLNTGNVFCHTCIKAMKNGLVKLDSSHETNFLVEGYSNWKKALEKFKKHQSSDLHRMCALKLLDSRQESVLNHLNKHVSQEQFNARVALLKIITSLRYLATEGSALRGKQHDGGKFMNLLHLRSEDSDKLHRFLQRKTTYTSHDIQNELLELMSREVLNDIISRINKESVIFATIVDGTTDVSGNEQECICIRHINKDMEIAEDFIGLYRLHSTTGKAIAEMLVDVLLRTQLPISNLRAQTYDGASNMSGAYSGCQAKIKESQPLALYTHCGAHITNLVTAKAAEAAPLIRDALDATQVLGTLYTQSGKFKNLYHGINSDQPEAEVPSSLKPICPTRWLTRKSAVSSLLKNYKSTLRALDDAARCFGTTTAARASGLYTTLRGAKCFLGLKCSLPLLGVMEGLNRGLQGTEQTVDGMLQSVDIAKRELGAMRDSNSFREIFVEAEDMVEHVDAMEAFPQPRKRKLPARLGAGFVAPPNQSVEDSYRVQYFSVLDSAISNLESYFTSADLREYGRAVTMLVTGEVDKSVIQKYPELSEDLETELPFFRRRFLNNEEHPSMTVEDIRKIWVALNHQVQKMFPAVEQLLRLVLISPASSCSAERSFSALRRIKTWLRNSTGQARLNHLMVCSVHSQILMGIDPQIIAQKFIESCDERRKVFGCFS